MLGRYVVGLAEADAADAAEVGGKARQLAVLSRIDGVRVPSGFCVTAAAFRRIMAEIPAVDELFARLENAGDDGIRALSAEIRAAIEAVPVPGDLAAEITEAVRASSRNEAPAGRESPTSSEVSAGSSASGGSESSGVTEASGGDELPAGNGASGGGEVAAGDGESGRSGPSGGNGTPAGDVPGGNAAFAVRSSATAEDLPEASFAGQQDSFLNVAGTDAVLAHVQRVWASLFTERAVAYRRRNGFDHRRVFMAVVVQRMVAPDAAGVLFTADPVTSDRRLASVEAAVGLGEALVSGRAHADSFTVRDGEILTRAIAVKPTAVRAAPGGGVQDVAVDDPARPALTDAQVVRLVALGRRIEAQLGVPQDIEWCLTGDDISVVQSRPITTLFPIPAAGDGENHVYVSVGHQQMMTDAMKPLGLSLWQMTTPRPMAEAGGRLFVDVTAALASPTGRANLVAALGTSDPLTGDALRTIAARDGFIRTVPDGERPWAAPGATTAPIEADPALVTALVEHVRASVAAAEHDLRGRSGADLMDAVRADVEKLRRVLSDPRSLPVIVSAQEAATWLNDRLSTWLGERDAADTLARSAPGNVTAEMGLALLDVADVIRPHPELVAHLGEHGLDGIDRLDGGPETREAITNFLHVYGMRCPGEIDITRPRWSEEPAMLIPLLLGNVRNFAAGAGTRRFAEKLAEARAAEDDVLRRVRALPDGEAKAAETKRVIDRLRTFSGYREFPKYGMVSRYLIYKRALLAEAARLVAAGVLHEPEDVFYLRFDELDAVVRSGRADHDLIRRRKDEFRFFRTLTAPRVLTSDGEAVRGAYRRDDVPDGALAGLAVSAGTVEGRARVVLDLSVADLAPGDILVTAYTDPSWTPAFVAVTGLVTEVGGLMTHGAVIAREYGLPAVVGVVGATRLIRDGSRIRVHGTDGFVELLD
ncbi:rifamycin-inactivating phosphotransferase [Catenuloplanes indicus]|uniref:Pyruvate,water dikinase n=1 Tax=Catenuloplanes indicus TaxID=137267 RepID=A0AAE3VUJ2_9ACTN|nr:rifamycin-inactivating phosphotransferase [Catenuloplanes indicus]MDQ0364086.1 pyruvate,water dikinase [Catenuloplanes indicus]